MPHIIADNALALYHLLPDQAHFHPVLLSHLFRLLEPHDVAKLTGAGLSTVHAARHRFPNDYIGDLGAVYSTGVHRQRIPTVELAAIATLIREECTQKSGKPLQMLTNDELYQRYLQKYSQSLCELVQSHGSEPVEEPALATLLSRFEAHQQTLAFLALVRSSPPSSSVSVAFAGGHQPGPIDTVLELLQSKSTSVPAPAPRSKGVFNRVLSSLPVQHTHNDWGQFDCPHCARGPSDIAECRRLSSLPHPLSSANARALAEAEQRVEDYNDHIAVVQSQCTAADEALADPDPSHAAVVWDFGTIDAHTNVGDPAKVKPFHVLMMVIHRGGRRIYVDIFVQDQTAQNPDIFFAREGLLLVLDQTPFFSNLTLLTLISDTCAGEFRSKHTFAQGGSFQKRANFPVRLLFKAPKHGKGIADAHKGHMMRMLNRYLKRQTQLRHDLPGSAAQLLTPFPDAESLALFLSTAFKTVEYHPFVLPTVDRNPLLKADVRRVPGTMCIHDVTFESPDTLLVKHLSSDARADVIHLHFKAPYSVDGVFQRCCVLCVLTRCCCSGPLSAAAAVQRDLDADSASASSVAVQTRAHVKAKSFKRKEPADDEESKEKRTRAEPASTIASSAAAAELALPHSALTFEDVRTLKHVVFAHVVPEEPEVQLWHADIMGVNAEKQTVDVRIREWTLLIRDVQPSSIFKPSAALPAV
jgi:hypothetical protein